MTASLWPERMECERIGCGRVICWKKGDTFSMVSVAGNVVSKKGNAAVKHIDSQHIVCAACSKKLNSGFKRKNKGINLKG